MSARLTIATECVERLRAGYSSADVEEYAQMRARGLSAEAQAQIADVIDAISSGRCRYGK